MGRCFPAKAPPVADVNDTLTLTRMYGKMACVVWRCLEMIAQSLSFSQTTAVFFC